MPIRLDQYLRERARRMEAAGVPEARLNLDHVLARHLGIPRLDLILHQADYLPEAILAKAEADAARLEAGEPLPYILGEMPFHGLMLTTDARALIPRPETEWLVEQVLACGVIWRQPEPRVADIGTGTGCIALAIATVRPSARVLAVDADPAALSLALENRDRLGLGARVEMRTGDLLAGVPADSLEAVVSNPPYIPTAVCETLERHVREQEPRRALDGGADGLAVIRRLAGEAAVCLKAGQPLWLEIGFDQGPAVRGILEQAGFGRVAIHRDWAGLDRAACGFRDCGS